MVPLRSAIDVTRLDSAAGLEKLTTPVRYLEVLIAVLARHRLDWQAKVRWANLQNPICAGLTSLAVPLPPCCALAKNRAQIPKHSASNTSCVDRCNG